MAKPILVSGIQPTGRLHIGNYLGMLRNAVELQKSDKYDCHYFIADLHALTELPSSKDLKDRILQTTASAIAAGLDPKRSVIFQQSRIPAHSELMWILTTITPEGELRRMTQYKDKVVVKKNETNTGLLMYPVLMAADILLYDAAFVPVGEDQVQHLEIARTLARRFNTRYGNTFMEPKPILTKTSRVMGLKNPQKKMSKSDPESCLFLDDGPTTIKEKLMRAVTDSGSEIRYDKAQKPGVSNLLEIYAELKNITTKRAEEHFRGANYHELKSELVKIVIDCFADFRKKKKELLAKPETLKKILRDGSAHAAKIADTKIANVKRKVGL